MCKVAAGCNLLGRFDSGDQGPARVDDVEKSVDVGMLARVRVRVFDVLRVDRNTQIRGLSRDLAA